MLKVYEELFVPSKQNAKAQADYEAEKAKIAEENAKAQHAAKPKKRKWKLTR